MCEVGVFVALAAAGAFFFTYINVDCTYFAKHMKISLNTWCKFDVEGVILRCEQASGRELEEEEEK